MISSCYQIPTVVFLSEMLSFQDSFAKHYAEGLDGCGLDLESRVRKSYYVFIRRLVDSFQGTQRRQLKRYFYGSSGAPLHFIT